MSTSTAIKTSTKTTVNRAVALDDRERTLAENALVLNRTAPLRKAAQAIKVPGARAMSKADLVEVLRYRLAVTAPKGPHMTIVKDEAPAPADSTPDEAPADAAPAPVDPESATAPEKPAKATTAEPTLLKVRLSHRVLAFMAAHGDDMTSDAAKVLVEKVATAPQKDGAAFVKLTPAESTVLLKVAVSMAGDTKGSDAVSARALHVWLTKQGVR